MADSNNPYDQDLPKNAANYQPLTPLGFLERSASVFPEHTAIIHGDISFNYREFYARSCQLADALAKRGIGPGDTVSIMAPNIPPMLEAHYGVPMTGGIINPLNYRLDAAAIAFILDHGGCKILLTDTEFAPVIKEALTLAKVRPLVIDIDDPQGPGGELLGECDYETFISSGSTDYQWSPPADEWDALALNYTSGTTGNPKGVVFHHRGAYLLATANIVTAAIPQQPVYLWTLPMFHCNGWCFTWSLSVVAGTHICLRNVVADKIYAAIAKYKVSHLCGAPIVMGMLINATDQDKVAFDHSVSMMTAAAPPPAAVIADMQAQGFDITHLYGLTETYGPSVICDWNSDWDALPAAEQARLKSRQGVRYPALEGLSVRDPETMDIVPNDGETIGEVMMQGNIIMKGYFRNPAATQEAFANDWFHSGDLAVVHSDGYIELKDRSKDIIISGGENISSIEVEDTLYAHEAVQAAAVVARNDEKWGEVPCAFIELKPDAANVTEQDIIGYCRDNLAHFKCPRHVIFGEVPKTSTGKIQKFKLRDEANKPDGG